MDKLIDRYIALVFQYQDLQAEEILNRFIRMLKPEEVQLMMGKSPLFLHTAYSVRNASPELMEYTVTIYLADKSRGILDVEVTEHYKQPFKPGKVTVRKTAVLEEYNNADDEKVNYTITFSEKEKVIKQFALNRDAKIPVSQIPSGYSKYKYNGKEYTSAQLQTVIVNQDMQITCIK